MKFKTLKDLYLTKDKLQAEAIREELKAEAIKWEKEHLLVNASSSWAMWEGFFNITKKDLK